MKLRTASILGGIVALAAIGSLIAVEKQPPPDAAVDSAPKSFEARKERVSFTLHLSGEIQSSTQSLVRAETGGVVGSIFVTEGQLVQKGDALCEITSRKKRAERDKAVRNAEVARLEVEKKRAELKASDSPEIDSWELKIAEEKLRIAEMECAEHEIDVERLNIKAPFSGRVASIEVKVGDLVTGSSGFSIGSAILQLVPDAEFAINTNIGEHELVNLEHGKKVYVVVPALNDRMFEARVTRLAQVGVQSNTRARVFPLTVVFSGGDASIRIGMTGKINVPITREQEVIMLPIAAIENDANGSYVNVTTDGRRERRAVSIGLATAAAVEIISGINEGETVVLR